MSIDKWLSKGGSKEEVAKREKAIKQLTEDQVQKLKKKKIQDMVKKQNKNSTAIKETESLLGDILEFKSWLNQRTYLKGDIQKIETRIRNLYSKIQTEAEQERKSIYHSDKKKFLEDYKKIPLKFLDEKTRIAINKKIHGAKRTNSDNYYLRKLRNIIKEKLYEANYYEILEKILES